MNKNQPIQKQFKQLAQELLPTDQAATYNQAIMDFGATQCMPKKPNCSDCPLDNQCQALANKKVQSLPFKSKKIKHKKRNFYYLVIQTPQGIWLRHRGSKDVWQGLYDFPLIESKTPLLIEFSLENLKQEKNWQKWLDESLIEKVLVSPQYKQTLSHQKISTFFIEVIYKGDLQSIFEEEEKFILTKPKKIQTFAVPKMIAEYLATFGNKKF